MAELNTRKGSAGDTPTEKSTDDAAASASSADSTAAETAKSADTAATANGKPADAKPETAEPKAADATKPVDPKPADAKPADAKPADAKPAETKADAKPADSKTDAKPAAAKAAAVAAPVIKDPLTGEDITDDAGKDQDGKDQGADKAAAGGAGGVSEEALSAAAATYAKPAKVKKQRSKPPALVLALAGLLVLLLVGAGLLGWHQYQASQAREDRTLALQTARDVASNLTTITSENFNGQIDALSKISTNTFKEQMTGYSAMFGAMLKQGNVQLRGTVTSAGLEKVEGDSAAALVTVSTLITSGQQPQGVPQSFGLLVSLQRDGDRWLASNVDFLR